MSAISLAGNMAGIINTMLPFNEYEVRRDKKTGQILSWRQKGTKGGDNYGNITYKEADGPMFIPREVSKVTDIPVKTVYVTDRNYNGYKTRVPGAIIRINGEPQALGDDLVGKGFALYVLRYAPLRILYGWLTAPQTPKTVDSEMTTVGRWMSKTEYAGMENGAPAAVGAGGKTSVTVGGPNVWRSAEPGSVYVEFQVPTNSLVPGGGPGIYSILGPNASRSQLYQLQKLGGQVSPPVQNISPILKVK